MNTVPSINNITIGETLSLSFIGPGIIPDLKYVTYIGSVSSAALHDNATAAINHANLYPHLPEGHSVPDDYKGYNYLVFKIEDTLYEYGIPWVNEGSIKYMPNVTAIITIKDFNKDDKLPILKVLNDLKYGENITFTTQ